MAAAPQSVSVVLPVFAETATVREIVDRLRALLGPRLLEVLVVTSPRSPADAVAACEAVRAAHPGQVRVFAQRRSPGVGYAFREGLAETAGDLVLLMDSDGEMDPDTVRDFVRVLDQGGVDLVVGSRWMAGGGAEGYEPRKAILNRGYHVLFRLLYRTRVHDLTFGFKMGRAAALKALPLEAQFQEIGADVTLRALKAGLVVREVPTVWRKRKEGVSTNPLRRNLRYASLALRILLSKS